MTYNYFPEDINSDDVMKMRFELADTDVSKDEMSAALSDEEITAVLEQYPDNFKMAKLKLKNKWYETGIFTDRPFSFTCYLC